MGRVSTGVKGSTLRPGDEVVDMVVVREDSTLLTICEKGYGKRTNQAEEEVMVVTLNGIMIRMQVEGLSTIGRNTQGVRVINLGDGDRVVDMTRLPKSENEILDHGGENGGIGQAGEGGIKPVGAALFAALGLDLKRCLIYI